MYLRLIDSFITQLKAQGPSRTCNESKEEEEHSTIERDIRPGNVIRTFDRMWKRVGPRHTADVAALPHAVPKPGRWLIETDIRRTIGNALAHSTDNRKRVGPCHTVVTTGMPEA